MSKMSKVGVRRTVGAAAIASAAAVALASTGAGSAAAQSLPNGVKTTIGVDGSAVKISRTGETAMAIGTESHNGADRAGQVSGNVFATFPKGSSGVLTTGYVVGCQVDISKLEFAPGINFGQSIDLLSTSGTPLTLTGGLDLGLTIPLTPGQAKVVKIGSKSGDSGTLGVQYKHVRINLDKCGGRAEARAISTIEIRDDNYVKSSLYGKPFSLN